MSMKWNFFLRFSIVYYVQRTKIMILFEEKKDNRFFLAAQRCVTLVEKWLQSLVRVGVSDDVNYVERMTHLVR